MRKRNVSVSLDRVTISGKIEFTDDVLIDMSKLGWHSKNDYFLLDRDLGNDDFENVAGLFRNEYQDTWRLDTSNHFQNSSEKNAVKFIISLMEKDSISFSDNAHLTRIDVAFDFKNGDKPNMAHNIYRFNTTDKTFSNAVYRGRGKGIETIYSGARKSGFMIRYYDKLVEQRRHRKKVDPRIKKWERLEVQLRGKKTDEWVESAVKTLSCFKMPNFENIEDLSTRAMIVALDSGVVQWNELSKNSKTRYHKLFESSQGFDTEYADLAVDVFLENVDKIQAEIDEFFEYLNRK